MEVGTTAGHRVWHLLKVTATRPLHGATALRRKERAMFNNVLENIRKATEANVQMQQEMFKKWVGLWPGMNLPSPLGEAQIKTFQEKWAETVKDLLARQRSAAEVQFKAGLENIEKAFRLGEAKSAEELQTRTMDLWRKCFQTIQEAYEHQIRDCQSALEKWLQMLAKPAA